MSGSLAASPSLRIVTVQDQRPVIRGWLVAPTPLVCAAKDPRQTTMRGVDLSAVLRGRAIVDLRHEERGVAVAWCAFDGAVVSVLLQGGDPALPASVELRAICDDGSDEVATLMVPIVASLTLPDGDTSQPSYVLLAGLGISFAGAPVLLGQQAGVALGGLIVTFDGAPLSF